MEPPSTQGGTAGTNHLNSVSAAFTYLLLFLLSIPIPPPHTHSLSSGVTLLPISLERTDALRRENPHHIWPPSCTRPHLFFLLIRFIASAGRQGRPTYPFCLEAAPLTYSKVFPGMGSLHVPYCWFFRICWMVPIITLMSYFSHHKQQQPVALPSPLFSVHFPVNTP